MTIHFRKKVLKQLRKHDINMHELSKGADVPYPCIYGWLKQGRDIRVQTLEKIISGLSEIILEKSQNSA